MSLLLRLQPGLRRRWRHRLRAHDGLGRRRRQHLMWRACRGLLLRCCLNLLLRRSGLRLRWRHSETRERCGLRFHWRLSMLLRQALRQRHGLQARCWLKLQRWLCRLPLLSLLERLERAYHL